MLAIDQVANGMDVEKAAAAKSIKTDIIGIMDKIFDLYTAEDAVKKYLE